MYQREISIDNYLLRRTPRKSFKAKNRKVVVTYIVFCIDVSKSNIMDVETNRADSRKEKNTLIHDVGDEADISLNIY